MNGSLKILIAGTPGAGKSTSIHAVSEFRPQAADLRDNRTALASEMARAGMDYGELTLDNGSKLCLYGTPAAERFGFIWRILSRGALGLIVLVDNRRPDPLADLDAHLRALTAHPERMPCVVAVCRMDAQPRPDLDDYARQLQQHGVLCPVVAADVRDAVQVAGLIELLLLQLQAVADAGTS